MSSIQVSITRQAGIEKLLTPVLAVVARAGSLRIAEIIQRLAAQGLLGPDSLRRVPNVTSEAGQVVVEAAIALQEASLLQPVRPAVWRVTPAGMRLLGKNEAISFETLKRRPSYKNYLRQLAAEKRRRDWQALRYDFYVSGRILTLEGSIHAGPATLAYALEYSLKAALGELREGLVPASILKSHNLLKVYHVCLKHNLLLDTFISDDFLEYAQHHFERRYPKGQTRILKERRYWTFARSYLHAYDDCLIQLDRGLDQLYGSGQWSLGNRALTYPGGSRMARAFFHDNVFALDRLAAYRTSVDDRWLSFPEPEHLDRPDLLFSASEGLPYPGVTYQKARALLDLDLAALFVYPGATEPRPDPARTYLSRRSPLPANAHSYSWILDRLRQEFGDSAVELVEDGGGRTVVIYVYDRGAKQYWAALEVTRQHFPLLTRDGYTKQTLERWIRRVKEQFASERRDLRLPKR